MTYFFTPKNLPKPTSHDRRLEFLKALRTEKENPQWPSHRYAREDEPSLYMVRHPWEHWIKVGVARDVRRRMQTYRHAWGVKLPQPPKVVLPANIALLRLDAFGLEREILARFSSDVVRSEWLRLTPRMLELEAAADDPAAIATLLGLCIPGLAVA